MKAREIREMSDEQLELTVKEAASKLMQLRIKSQTERVSTTTEVRTNRRLIARVKTIQHQRKSAVKS